MRLPEFDQNYLLIRWSLTRILPGAYVPRQSERQTLLSCPARRKYLFCRKRAQSTQELKLWASGELETAMTLPRSQEMHWQTCPENPKRVD
jgi:hypothetical protein